MISLVLVTIGRKHYLRRFIQKLSNQNIQEVELILVDQSGGNLKSFKNSANECSFSVLYTESDKGLSRGRNGGISMARGDIIGFPDDDCWYEDQHLLQKVRDTLRGTTDILTGIIKDNTGREIMGNWLDKSGEVSRKNVWYTSSSASMFVKKKVIDTIGGFDEKLGVGAETGWESAEEHDFLIRAMEKDYNILYDKTIIVRHPNPKKDKNYKSRGFKYGAGEGAVWRKHKYNIGFVYYKLVRSFAGYIWGKICNDNDKAFFYWGCLKGRLDGWYKYGKTIQ